METYTNGPNDQPTTCPKCGTRTEFEDISDVIQEHRCPRCGYKFHLEHELEPEAGAASIRIDKTGGVITVYHGTDGDVLQKFTARKGAWDAIWEGIEKAKALNQL